MTKRRDVTRATRPADHELTLLPKGSSPCNTQTLEDHTRDHGRGSQPLFWSLLSEHSRIMYKRVCRNHSGCACGLKRFPCAGFLVGSRTCHRNHSEWGRNGICLHYLNGSESEGQGRFVGTTVGMVDLFMCMGSLSLKLSVPSARTSRRLLVTKKKTTRDARHCPWNGRTVFHLHENLRIHYPESFENPLSRITNWRMSREDSVKDNDDHQVTCTPNRAKCTNVRTEWNQDHQHFGRIWIGWRAALSQWWMVCWYCGPSHSKNAKTYSRKITVSSCFATVEWCVGVDASLATNTEFGRSQLFQNFCSWLQYGAMRNTRSAIN